MTRENLSNVPSTAASDLLQGLSPRQRAIAERYASGLTYRQIAAELFIAPATVRNHLATIYRELEIDNKADLIRRMTAAEQAAETLEAITAAAALDAAPEPAATTTDDRIDDRIYEWLQALSLERYAEIFAANAIDWHTLPTLNDEDLQAIGIDLIGHRKKLLQALDGLNMTIPGANAIPEIPPGSIPVATPSERRHLSVMACELVGASVRAGHDPEDLSELMHAYETYCAEVIAPYEGYIARIIGSSLLVYFGWPQAHEDDAERALRAALALIDGRNGHGVLRDPALSVRIGVAAGTVVVKERSGAPEIIGQAPTMAGKLAGRATPGTVVIESRLRALSGATFTYIDLGDHVLEGLSEPLRLLQVCGVRAAESRFEQRSVQLTPLAGRQAELQLLQARWSQAATGEGQVVLLSGDAGIGKSRIVHELSAALLSEDQNRIRRYQCSPFHCNTALYPFITQLNQQLERQSKINGQDKQAALSALAADIPQPPEQVLPLLTALLSIELEAVGPAPVLSAKQRKDATLTLLRQLTLAGAGHQPLLLILEDIHWLDPSSGELLEQLINTLQSIPGLFILTTRPGFAAAWTDYPHVTTLALNRLSREQVLSMVDTLAAKSLPLALHTHIADETDGIPLFVEEMTKAVLESGTVVERGDRYEFAAGSAAMPVVPVTLQDALMARLDRLGPVKQIAQTGAAIGREFPYPLLAEVAPVSEEPLRHALSELVSHKIIFAYGAPPNTTYTFKHALIRDIAYESLLKTQRCELHVRIAETLTGHFPDVIETKPEVVAHHYTAAGLGEQAAVWWQTAGQHATKHFAHVEAVVHFNAGLEAINSITDAARQTDCEIELLLELVASLRILGRYQNALDALNRLEKLAMQNHRMVDLAKIYYLRGNIYFPLGDSESCYKAHGIALRFAEQAGSAEYQARALSGLADAHYLQGRMLTAFANYNRCIEVCRTSNFKDIEVANLPMRGWGCYYQNDLTGALDDCLAGIKGAEHNGNHRAEMLARSASSFFLWEMGNFEESMAQCEKAAELTQRLGAKNFEPFQLLNFALLLAQDDPAKAIQLARKGVDICHETGPSFVGPWALGALAVVAENRRQSREALEAGEQLLGSDCVAHCHLWFYRHAMDAALKWEDWENAARFASKLEDYTAQEPLPCCDFFVLRTRSLVSNALKPDDPDTRSTISRLRRQAEQSGFTIAMQALTQVGLA